MQTNYYFTVSTDALEGALDRFAQFFVAPLFTESATFKEMNAVNSENSKNLNSDPWRLDQLMKDLSSPDSAFSLFSTGSLATLNKTGIRDALLSFHAKYYTAPNMKLVVVGKESVGALVNMTLDYFQDVRGASTPPAAGMPGVDTAGRTKLQPAMPADYPVVGNTWPSELLGKLVMYKPIASQHVIQFIWPLPGAVSQHGSYREAFNLVTHVLGFEGNGSILSYLRSSNVAEGVSAGYSVRGRGLTMLEVDVSLTTHAVENIGLNESAIIAASAIFRQLELLKSALPRMGEGQPLRYLWEDIIRSDVQAYEFGAKAEPDDLVQTLAR